MPVWMTEYTLHRFRCSCVLPSALVGPVNNERFFWRAPVVNPKDSGPRWCEGEEATCHPHRALAPNKHPGDFPSPLHATADVVLYSPVKSVSFIYFWYIWYILMYICIHKYTHTFFLCMYILVIHVYIVKDGWTKKTYIENHPQPHQ